MRETLRLPLAFFASGAAALLFEVLWFRALGRVVGNTVWAGALVLTAFMLGMALGGMLAARWAARIGRPARAFAAAELTVALAGTLVVWSLPELEALFGRWLTPLVDSAGALMAVRLALSLAALLVPTTAMGMTLAFGVRVLAHRETARALGLLYAANTFGACLAPLVAEYHLIGALGLRGTALAAAALNLLAASLAWRLQARAALAPPQAASPASPRRLLAAAALAGALALALEVIWFRLLLLYAPGSDVNFAVMLSVILLGIGIGGALAPRLARAGFAWVAALSSVTVVAGYQIAGPLVLPGRPDLLEYAIALMLPAAVCSGALFTLLGAGLRAGAENPQAAIGRLTMANTLGAAAGAALAGLALLPAIGMERSLFVLAAGYAALPFLLFERGSARRIVPPFVAAAAALAFFPFGRIDAHLSEAAFPYELTEPGSKVVKLTEGPTTTLQLLRRDRFGEPFAWRLLTDSFSMTAVNRYAMRYMRLFAWLPLALHERPRRALLISYGAGNTAQALLSEPALERLTVVDLSPEILGASPVIHGADDPLRDPRVRLVQEDGRQFLRTRDERFDIITSEPPPPSIAGVVNLYTREYFAAVAAHLAPGGLATYWLPVTQFEPDGARAVTAAFCEAFRDCTLWIGGRHDWVLMGGRDFRHRAGTEQLVRLWRGPAAARLVADGFEQPMQLGAAFSADAAQLRTWYGDIAPVGDNWPKRLRPEHSLAAPFDPYAPLLDAEGSRRRFLGSDWIAGHWPAEWLGWTAQYFVAQPVLNGQVAADPVATLPTVDSYLRRTDLRVPVLWLLDSDATEQEIVDRRIAAGDDGAKFAYPLGVRALAQRDYPLAAKLFTHAAERNARQAGALAAYSLCRSGAPQRARRVPGAEHLAPELRCWKGAP